MKKYENNQTQGWREDNLQVFNCALKCKSSVACT